MFHGIVISGSKVCRISNHGPSFIKCHLLPDDDLLSSVFTIFESTCAGMILTSRISKSLSQHVPQQKHINLIGRQSWPLQGKAGKMAKGV